MITRGTYRKPFNKLAKRTSWRLSYLFALEQDVQNVAILINCTPQVMNASIDLEEHFIKMPPVARPRSSPSQVIGIFLAELETPFSDGLIG